MKYITTEEALTNLEWAAIEIDKESKSGELLQEARVACRSNPVQDGHWIVGLDNAVILSETFKDPIETLNYIVELTQNTDIRITSVKFVPNPENQTTLS